MSQSPQASPAPDLGERLADLGRTPGEREAGHPAELDAARGRAERVRGDAERALERFHAAAEAAGAPHLRVTLSEIRTDDKHLRAVEFDLLRGRHKAIVVAKSRGELTLVGPFHVGKPEGPCRSFPFDARPEIEQALGTFLESFLEEAATP